MARLAWAVGFEPPRPDGRKEQRLSRFLAGAAGFEPANAGIKSRCLTTWRRPSRRVPWTGEAALIAAVAGKKRATAFVRRLVETAIVLTVARASLSFRQVHRSPREEP